MPSPNTDPNKRNFGDGVHHHSGLRTFGIPCAEDARSVPQTRSDRYAYPIVYLRRGTVPEGRFSTFRFKSFPTELHATLFLGRDLRLFVKYFTGHQWVEDMPIPKRPVRLPEVRSKQEVRRLIQ